MGGGSTMRRHGVPGRVAQGPGRQPCPQGSAATFGGELQREKITGTGPPLGHGALPLKATHKQPHLLAMLWHKHAIAKPCRQSDWGGRKTPILLVESHLWGLVGTWGGTSLSRMMLQAARELREGNRNNCGKEEGPGRDFGP